MGSRLFIVALLLTSTYSASSCSDGEVCEEGGASSSFSHYLQPPERVIQQISHQISATEGVAEASSAEIYVSIRTTLKYHSTRLPPILLTWIRKFSPSQVVAMIQYDITDLSSPPPPPQLISTENFRSVMRCRSRVLLVIYVRYTW